MKGNKTTRKGNGTMKKADVRTGAVYAAKVSGVICRVKLADESPYGGWNGRNLETGRTIRIKSARQLRWKIRNDYTRF